MTRPKRSNQSLSQDRAIRAVRVIYQTRDKLQKLLRRIVKRDRKEWFAARVRELNSWPLRSKDEIMDAASRVNPTKTKIGKWIWPKRELEIQQDLLNSAPEPAIDISALRDALEGMDNRTGDRLIEMLADSKLLKSTTVPLDTGLPQPKEIATEELRWIKWLNKKLASPDLGEPIVPRATIRSNWGATEPPPQDRLGLVGRAFRFRGRHPGAE